MKIHVDIDCTPEEARTFLGLPDLGPIQQTFVDEMSKRMGEIMAKMDPESVFRAWMPQGMGGWEEWRKMWEQAAAGAKDKK